MTFLFPYTCFVHLSPFSMERALPGEDKARTKSAPKPLQNTLHGKRALDLTIFMYMYIYIYVYFIFIIEFCYHIYVAYKNLSLSSYVSLSLL